MDVGHGNCSLVSGGDSTVLIDCAPGITVIEVLRRMGVTRIHAVFLSHADADHIGGLVNILAQPDLLVERVYANPDAGKDTTAWMELRIAVADARQRHGLEVTAALTSQIAQDFGAFLIEVLAPAPEVALAGPGGLDLKGRRLTSNSMSTVIGVRSGARRVAVLAGDIDFIGLTNMLEESNDLAAEILVFPHHGGLPPGGDAEAFAASICDAVRPRLVVFSFARNRHNYPLPAIVTRVSASLATAHILCTQLSHHCSPDELAVHDGHPPGLPSAGTSTAACCGGTILVEFSERNSSLPAVVQSHSRFVNSHVASPLCIPRTRVAAS
jgi:competence protein ComEC